MIGCHIIIYLPITFTSFCPIQRRCHHNSWLLKSDRYYKIGDLKTKMTIFYIDNRLLQIKLLIKSKSSVFIKTTTTTSNAVAGSTNIYDNDGLTSPCVPQKKIQTYYLKQ